MEMKIGESSSALKRVVQEKNIDRKKNLILHNIPESCHTEAKVRQDHDMKEIGKITDVLCGNENKIKICRRFDSTDGRMSTWKRLIGDQDY